VSLPQFGAFSFMQLISKNSGEDQNFSSPEENENPLTINFVASLAGYQLLGYYKNTVMGIFNFTF